MPSKSEGIFSTAVAFRISTAIQRVNKKINFNHLK
jgi:hypothetical protein